LKKTRVLKQSLNSYIAAWGGGWLRQAPFKRAEATGILKPGVPNDNRRPGLALAWKLQIRHSGCFSTGFLPNGSEKAIR
jgi:hypothetical protein